MHCFAHVGSTNSRARGARKNKRDRQLSSPAGPDSGTHCKTILGLDGRLYFQLITDFFADFILVSAAARYDAEFEGAKPQSSKVATWRSSWQQAGSMRCFPCISRK